MRIVATGGGSGGHVFPIFALLPHLKTHADVCYIGESGKLEERLCAKHGVPFYPISATKLKRGEIAANLSIPIKLFKSVRQATDVLTELSPDLVFSKGGYVALPVAIAAKRLGIPVVIHESDRTMGLSNRLCAPFATKILTSFELKNNGKKYITTSSPIRDEVKNAKPRRLFNNAKPTLLVLGGSLGAKELNDYVNANLKRINASFNVVLISGDKKGESVKKDGYIELPFAENVGEYMASSDVCLTRGGSGILFELAVMRLPSVVLPLNNKASRGEQTKNAEYFAEKGIFHLHRKDADILAELTAVYANRLKYLTAMKNSRITDGKHTIIHELLTALK